MSNFYQISFYLQQNLSSIKCKFFLFGACFLFRCSFISIDETCLSSVWWKGWGKCVDTEVQTPAVSWYHVIVSSFLNLIQITQLIQTHVSRYRFRNLLQKQETVLVLQILYEHICDMIKRNESDVGDIVFEILAKTVFKFLSFILFLAVSNPS